MFSNEQRLGEAQLRLTVWLETLKTRGNIPIPIPLSLNYLDVPLAEPFSGIGVTFKPRLVRDSKNMDDPFVFIG